MKGNEIVLLQFEYCVASLKHHSDHTHVRTHTRVRARANAHTSGGLSEGFLILLYCHCVHYFI